MPIRKLPPQLVNQIAAGEVVERPSSVLKELLENSLDAGATRIAIDVQQGGIKRLRVVDNGTGIPRDELNLALSRHATSKVGSLEELERVVSLGFRGEALPSIASVSRLKLASRAAGEPNGWSVRGDGGEQFAEPVPLSHPMGTTVEVCDLFFNVPARRKFLRTERTEFSHLHTVVHRLALSRFDVAFELSHNQKAVDQLREAAGPASREARIAAVCGRQFAENAVYLEQAGAGLRLWGWVARPTFSRSQADLQHFYVNGRSVRDKVVTHAVRQAYSDVLYHGRHPAFVLYLELDPTGVDANVHPSKHEVRFRDSRLVHDFLFHTLKQAIAALGPGAPAPAAPAVAGAEFRGPPGAGAGPGTSRPVQQGLPVGQAGVREQLHSYGAMARAAQEIQEADLCSGAAGPEGEGATAPPLGYAVAQLHGVYVLAQNARGLVVVDMHAAHERVTYERLKAAWSSGAVATQPLLVPLTVTMSRREAEAAERRRGQLAELGL